jgi:hypothetical protein
MREEPLKKKNPAAVKISPWTLARLNAEEVAKAAAEVRKKSKILQPVIRHDQASRLEPDSHFGSSGRRAVPTIENNKKHIYLPADISMESMTNVSFNNTNMGFIGRSGFAPPHLRSAFQTSQGMSSSAGIVSSPESSLDSPDIHTFRATGAEEARNLAGLSAAGAEALKEIPLSRSTSDGYDASGGEDSDQVPSRVVQRIADWSSVLFKADQDERAFRPALSSSMSHSRH